MLALPHAAKRNGTKTRRCRPPKETGGSGRPGAAGHGRGGRNHELVLGALNTWRQQGVANGLLLSFGTDGIDGSSDAAGAWCDDALLQVAPNPENALLDNNSHEYFELLNAQIKTGPTGSNVADLILSLP